MLGPIVNGIVIVICALAGKFFVKGLSGRFEEIIKKAIGLSILYIGIAGAMDNKRIMLLIVSMVAGSIIGEWINIHKAMNEFGLWAEKKFGFGEGNFAKGFVTSSILFCTGSMAIVGAMQSGLMGNLRCSMRSPSWTVSSPSYLRPPWGSGLLSQLCRSSCTRVRLRWAQAISRIG